MEKERFEKQLAFILEADKEKNILRQTHLTGHGRRENDAEHAWHMAMMIYLLREYSNEEFDVAKAMAMALIHDIVEIDAGDTYAYDDKALKSQKEREELAAERIFGLLPDDQREELQYNQQGELCMTGPTMMLQYYNNEKETNNVMKKHADDLMWIHTGDIGYITEDGVVFIVDRIKRMIIRPDGHNVWPSQIENVVTKYEDVLDCAVVGLPNPENENGRIPTAFVVVKEGITADEQLIDKIDAFCKQRLPERDVAMAYRFCDKLPLTLVGKVDYRALEKKS